MNLFRKHKKFEEQINEQLSGMEVKPSTSLWDRIDSGIADGPFENDMQNSLENFEQMPYPETWDKIASELPEEKAGNGLTRYVVSAALALLFVAGIYIGKNWNPATAPSATTYLETGKPAGDPVSREATETTSRAKALSSGEKKQQVQETNTQERSLAEKANAAIVPQKQADRVVTVARKEKPANKPVPKAIAYNQYGPAKRTSAQEVNMTIPASEIPDISQPAVTGKPRQEAITAENNEPGQRTEAKQPAKQVDAETPLTTGEKITDASQLPAVKEESAALQQPREIMNLQPDSLAVAQKMEEIKTYRDEEVFTSISLSAYAGVNICFTTYSSPKASSSLNFDKNIALRKELERPTADWSGGFVVDYRIGKRWMISSGVMMTNFNQKFDYNIEQAKSPSNANETGAPALNPNDSFAVGNQYSNRIKFSWTEIPLFVNYRISNGLRWNLDMQAGVSYGFLNTVDGGMISYDNKGVLVLRGKESFPNIQNALFVTAMPQLSCQFTPSVSLGFAPTVKYSVTSIIGNERWIQQHPYFIGANICLRKRF